MVTLGEKDGKASAAAGPQSVNDTFHFFTLKKKRDSRVKNVTFEEFVDMKANGAFEEYNVLEDQQMQAMFLQ